MSVRYRTDRRTSEVLPAAFIVGSRGLGRTSWTIQQTKDMSQSICQAGSSKLLQTLKTRTHTDTETHQEGRRPPNQPLNIP